MPDVEAINLLYVMFLLASSVIVLFLQAMAHQRHRHAGFLVLAISTLVVMASLVVGLLPYVTRQSEELWVATTLIYIALGSAGTILGIAGTVLLFRSYRHLAEENRHASAQISQLETQLAKFREGIPDMPTSMLPK